jgi:transposase-like protein
LRCNVCTRRFAIFNTRSLVVELDRLESRNGALLVPGCPKASCVTFAKSVTAHPRLYSRFGRNAAGRPRVRCGRCGTVFVFEDDHRSGRRKRIDKPLVRLFTNGVAIRGQARVAGVEIATIYRRLPFIWKKMQAVEEYKLQKFFAMRENQQIRLHLCTDGQDQLVNRWSRDRRDPVQLSCITGGGEPQRVRLSHGHQLRRQHGQRRPALRGPLEQRRRPPA